MQTNELKQKITEVFMSFGEFPEANIELFVDDILDLFKKEDKEKLRWIPVEEKLPETYSKILATIKSPECIWVEEIGFGEGKFQLPGRGDTNFVTHWMYVPEPPSFL